MTGFVDRSNTEWTPWPRLAKVPRNLQVVGGVLAIMSTAGVLYNLRKASAPPPPKTLSKEWSDATKARFEANPREAAGPVRVNPITRAREQS
jgi:Protein of unknown function (DUF1138)/Cytochrome c oxidase subunit IV